VSCTSKALAHLPRIVPVDDQHIAALQVLRNIHEACQIQRTRAEGRGVDVALVVYRNAHATDPRLEGTPSWGLYQPTLEAIRKLALALSVTSDEIVFDTDERGPDDQLRLQLEALSRLDERKKEIVMEVLDGLLLKHDAKRWVTREKAS
jgi:hypothetical protein